jgi:hypothetical protein
MEDMYLRVCKGTKLSPRFMDNQRKLDQWDKTQMYFMYLFYVIMLLMNHIN